MRQSYDLLHASWHSQSVWKMISNIWFDFWVFLHNNRACWCLLVPYYSQYSMFLWVSIVHTKHIHVYTVIPRILFYPTTHFFPLKRNAVTLEINKWICRIFNIILIHVFSLKTDVHIYFITTKDFLNSTVLILWSWTIKNQGMPTIRV